MSYFCWGYAANLVSCVADWKLFILKCSYCPGQSNFFRIKSAWNTIRLCTMNTERLHAAYELKFYSLLWTIIFVFRRYYLCFNVAFYLFPYTSLSLVLHLNLVICTLLKNVRYISSTYHIGYKWVLCYFFPLFNRLSRSAFLKSEVVNPLFILLGSASSFDVDSWFDWNVWSFRHCTGLPFLDPVNLSVATAFHPVLGWPLVLLRPSSSASPSGWKRWRGGGGCRTSSDFVCSIG